MAIELRQLLEGLDDSTISKVEETIKGNAKELDAKLFIDGDGEHYVPHARFDEVVKDFTISYKFKIRLIFIARKSTHNDIICNIFNRYIRSA